MKLENYYEKQMDFSPSEWEGILNMMWKSDTNENIKIRIKFSA